MVYKDGGEVAVRVIRDAVGPDRLDKLCAGVFAR